MSTNISILVLPSLALWELSFDKGGPHVRVMTGRMVYKPTFYVGIIRYTRFTLCATRY
jgi:hypothetical protein